MELCAKAQEGFGTFCIIPVVLQGQLYGGKMVAAPDRQHPVVKNVTSNWAIYNFEHFPGVKWKLQNLGKMKIQTPEKLRAAYNALADKLNEKQ